MCIVALKHFKNDGWVGVKNRDRNYYPTIFIKQSFRDNIERLFIWDDKTKYAEGLNEHGVSILNSAMAVAHDEDEGKEAEQKKKEKSNFYSPEGKIIRRALLEKSVKNALESCIEDKLPGNTICWDAETAYLMEASFKDDKYIHKYEKIEPKDTAVRTNHGIWLDWAGYHFKEGDKSSLIPTKSSRERLKIVRKDIVKVEHATDMLDCISDFSTHKNPQLNPLRVDEKEEAMRSTGQIMIIPSHKMLYYRPIWCEVEFDFNKLDSPETKTFFQILSSQPVLYKSKTQRRGSIIL